ncbi:hypothetical protein evm_010241 [Chilo suppressalis]|nr:hypothetical protein evm_010241 [Chilo suppressalis]
MNTVEWKKVKRCGNYHRQIARTFKNIMDVEISGTSSNHENVIKQPKEDTPIVETHDPSESSTEIINGNSTETSDGNSTKISDGNSTENDNGNNETYEETDLEENDDREPSQKIFQYKQIHQFRDAARTWAIENNISHSALKSLATLVNTINPNLLPVDPTQLTLRC